MAGSSSTTREIRRKLIDAIDRYTAFHRGGCTPPDAVNWSTGDRNNKAFLGQTVMMTVEQTLSIPNALKSERPEDYYENTATIEWPLGPAGEPFPIMGTVIPEWSSKMATTWRRPRNSCASWSARAGSPTISTSRASACYRRCRSCSMRRSGSTRATPTAWPR